MDIAEIITLILTVLLGLAVGSFLNVCIYRIPNHTFFSKARSFCPNCKSEIKWYDNIPIFSYIFLNGKCRSCKQRISPIYPFVELLNLSLYLGIFFTYGASFMTFIYYIVVSTLIVMSFIDLKSKEIPDTIHVIIIITALISFAPIDSVSWQSKLIGMAAISVPLLILAVITNGIGGGDVKLFFALGLLLGWENILVAFLLSVILAGIAGIAILVVKKKEGKKYELPFGPFIAVGAYISILCGEQLINCYISLFML